jgi:hypothetical protein
MAPGGDRDCAILGAISYFGFRFRVALKGLENSWAKGQTWDRNGTELVLAVRIFLGICTFSAEHAIQQTANQENGVPKEAIL